MQSSVKKHSKERVDFVTKEYAAKYKTKESASLDKTISELSTDELFSAHRVGHMLDLQRKSLISACVESIVETPCEHF